MLFALGAVYGVGYSLAVLAHLPPTAAGGAVYGFVFWVLFETGGQLAPNRRGWVQSPIYAIPTLVSVGIVVAWLTERVVGWIT